MINYKYNTDIIILQQVDENQFGETDNFKCLAARKTATVLW